MTSQILLVKTEEEIKQSYQVMKHLRADYTLEEYCDYVQKVLVSEGYELAILKENDEVLASVGFRIGHSLAWGKFIYVDDLVTDPSLRSGGYGEKLLTWVGEYGKEHGCKELHLDSGVQRHGAHRFYLRERMDIVFYHFKKEL